MSESTTPLPDTVSGRDLGELLGVTADRVRKLRLAGLIPAAGRDRFPLAESVRAYCAYLRRGGGQEPADLDPKREHALLLRARRELHELDLGQRRGDLLPREAVIATWQAVIAAARARLLALPTTLAPRLAAAKDLRETESLLRDYVHELLVDLERSTGVPAQRGRGGVAPASAADGEPVGGSAPAPVKRVKRRARAVADRKGAVPARDNGRAKRPTGGDSGRHVVGPGRKNRDRQ
jgi:hypothetical protein